MESPTRCPRCGFNFAWDGSTCSHCAYPPGRPAPPPVSRPWRFARAALVAAAVVAGAAIWYAELRQTLDGWNVRDVTAPYLGVSIVCGALDAAAAAVLLRTGGRVTRPVGLLLGVSPVWIPVSAVVAVGLLPAAGVPRWLPLAYLGYCLFGVAWAWVADRTATAAAAKAAVLGRPVDARQLPAATVPMTTLDFLAAVAFAAAAGYCLAV